MYEANFSLMNPPRQPLHSSEARTQGCARPHVLGSAAAAFGAPSVFNNHSNNPNNDWDRGRGRGEMQVGRNNI